MRYHAFDIGEVSISRCFSLSENIFGIEDIQPFILHRTHIEITHRDNHEALKIKLETIAFFIPMNRGY